MLARMSGPVAVRAGRRRWVLSQEAFWTLLSSLDPDLLRAGERYEALRRKLIIFFLGRGGRDPEDSADETLDRLSRRLAEGERIHDLGRFAHGVARRVHGEDLRRQRRDRLARAELAGSRASLAAAVDSDAGAECIRRCIERLDAGDRSLIVTYYAGSGHGLQEDRKELAAGLGLTPAALRVRAYRIRRSLESCTRDCLRGRTGAGGPLGGERR